jgi:hypothetical protein
MEDIHMRKAMLLLAVFGLAGSLWAADPNVGTWKLNLAKSKLLPSTQAPVKEETIVVREIGDQFEITIAGTRTDGSTISSKGTNPKQGGVTQGAAIPKDFMVMVTMISPNEWYNTYLQNGKQIRVGHFVISKDGKTMTDTGKGFDDKGKPVESLAVFDKQ